MSYDILPNPVKNYYGVIDAVACYRQDSDNEGGIYFYREESTQYGKNSKYYQRIVCQRNDRANTVTISFWSSSKRIPNEE